ncbi:hypothetical protein BDV98DRAFT_135641 [Pterulicium gracile]|uniref:Galactose-binding domain-like protein n=1 Tax=Pterulicium gracile TaxID=1884261 RepID=A0A5C3QMY4_9AGAR|nr:hypothetical protein BDV98DRAFT_135641 [Pterula gracilis]
MHIASSPSSPTDWTTTQRWYADLLPDFNVFTVSVTNTGAQAGLLIACRNTYDDGTIDTLVGDQSWKTIEQDPPANFQSPLFNDLLNWVDVVDQGVYRTTPWDDAASASFDELALPPVLDFSSSSAQWIWDVNPGSEAADSRAFKYTFSVPQGRVAKYATVIIAADNQHYLYVNGLPANYGASFQDAQRVVVNLAGAPDPDMVLFAVEVLDEGGPGGVIFAAQVVFDDGSSETVESGGEWKTLSATTPVDFMNPSVKDNEWQNAVVVDTTVGSWTAVVPPI